MYGSMEDESHMVSEIVEDRLFVTGLEGALDSQTLVKLDIKAVVSVLENKEKLGDHEFRGVEHVFLQADDDEGEVLSRHFPRFLDVMASYPRVLVHCERGVSRSVALAVLYLLHANRDMSVRDALCYVRGCRHTADPNAGFRDQLRGYAESRGSNSRQQ